MSKPERVPLPVESITVRSEDLPIVVRITRRDGVHKDYELRPAGKNKFGASLQGIPESLQLLFRSK